MSTNYLLRGAVRRVLLAAAVASAVPVLPAMAADADGGQVPETVAEVVVTGTRIRSRDYSATSPVTTVSSEQIAATGQLSVEEVLNKLPQVVPGLTANSNNPANGTSTVDLRGIGTPRTLVLINGRRLTPSTQTGVVDLNNVPVRLIDRVEVVTGGASAVYGSDALAGVVNFILKEDYQGFDLGMQLGQSAEERWRAEAGRYPVRRKLRRRPRQPDRVRELLRPRLGPAVRARVHARGPRPERLWLT